MRAFVALSAPQAWTGPLLRAQSHLPGGRKVAPEDLHLTLAFLADQPEGTLEAPHETLDRRALPAATLRPSGYGVLGSGEPRAVVLEVAPDPGLAALRDAVRRACRAVGIALGRERFRPHVTLARFAASAPADAARLAGAMARLDVPEMAAAAGVVALRSSRLTPDGPIYATLAAYRLRAA